MQFVATEEEDLTLTEDSIHTAQLLNITPKEIKWTDKNTGDPKSTVILEWWWEIQAGKYAGRRVKGTCDEKFSTHPNNRLRNWASVILDREIGAGFPLDTEDLEGLTADIVIGKKVDKKDSTRVYDEVVDVLPPTGTRQDDAPPF